MKTAKKRNAMKTAAFVFAFLTACTGMAGTISGTGIDSMLTVSAAREGAAEVVYNYYFKGTWTIGDTTYEGTSDMLYQSEIAEDWRDISQFGWTEWNGDIFWERQTTGLFANGGMFSLNSGDNVVIYCIKGNQYGNLEETKIASLGSSDEVSFSKPSGGETYYAKRYRRTGTSSGVKTTIDNFVLDVTSDSSGYYAEWRYIGEFDWMNKYSEENYNADIIQVTKEKFDLSPYTYKANGMASKVQIYSTSLDANSDKKLVAELSGNDEHNLAFLKSNNKNTGYIAVRTQGGASLDPFYGMVSMYRYDADKQDWVSFYAQGAGKSGQSYANILTLFPKAKTFPMLADKNVHELRVYRTIDGKKELLQTFDKKTFDGGWGAMTQTFNIENNKTAMGFCYGNEYENYSWEADYDYNFESGRYTTIEQGTMYGKFLANIPYVTVNDTSFVQEEKNFADILSSITGAADDYLSSDEEGTKPLPTVGVSPAYDEDGDGVEDSMQVRAIQLDERFAELEKGQHGNVYLYQNNNLIESYSPDEFDNGGFSIPDYNPNASYFLKVDHVYSDTAVTNFATYYKWNEEAGKWQFRVNTETSPVVTVPITYAEVSAAGAGNQKIENVSLKLVTGSNGNERSNTLYTWSGSEFENGTAKATLALQTNGVYEVVIDSVSKTSGYTSNFRTIYRYVGIDPAIYDTVGTITGKMYYAPPRHLTNAKANDNIVIDGISADGNEVHYELNSEIGNAAVSIPVEGEFTIIDTTAGYKADVKVSESADGTLQTVVTDKSSVDGRYINLTTPIEGTEYTVAKPQGDVIETGTVNGETLEISDLTISPDELQKQAVYAKFETMHCIVNAIENDAGSINAEVIEDGYLAVQNAEIKKIADDTAKGDVDADGKQTVKDVILLQKYLLNKQAYQAEDFINSDMNSDGKVNVFDLALLKRELLNK